MNALEAPFQALAINYFTYGFLTAVNNIWAWLAVITAAFSFWRIRASSSTPELASGSQEAASTSSASPKLPETEEAGHPVTVPSTQRERTISPARVLESEGSTKMKFSFSYEVDDLREDDSGDEIDDCRYDAAAISRRWCDHWVGTMVMRMGDMGWYKSQDRTVLDGSVVRLWEGRRQAAALVVEGGGVW